MLFATFTAGIVGLLLGVSLAISVFSLLVLSMDRKEARRKVSGH